MLSLDEVLRRLQGVRRQGGYWVARCPSHDDGSPSLSVKSGHGGRVLLNCFAGCSFSSIIGALDLSAGDLMGDNQTSRAQPIRVPVRPVRKDLDKLVARYAAALPGSLGEVYLANRGIDLELAQRFSIGYAAHGKWPSRRQAPHGRVVFPHTTPDGVIVNLYGRAVEFGEDGGDKRIRHDHLHGNKGMFNGVGANIARRDCRDLYVTEGSFDALALMAAGVPHAVAIFGVNGWRREWIGRQRRIILAFDADETGRREAEKIRLEAQTLADIVMVAGPGCYGGEKDAAKALELGVLQV